MSLFAIEARLPADYIGMRTRDVASPPILLLEVAIVVCALNAKAQPEPVRVAYSAAEGCPRGEEFAASVLTRGRNVTAVNDDSSATVRIAIATEPGGGYRGTLHMASSDRAAREVRGATCREVADALAVVTVSSLAPPLQGATAPTPIETTEFAPTPGETPATAMATPPPKPPTPTVSPPPHAVRESHTGNIGTAPNQLAVGPGTLKFDRDIMMTLYGGVQTGIVPGIVLPRFDFEVARTNFVTSPEGNSYRVVPTVRLHYTFFPPDPKQEYRSRYGATSAGGGIGIGADLCSPLYYDRTGLTMLLCAEFMGGYFAVQTISPTGVKLQDVIKGFSTGGLALDLAYNFGRHFHVGLKTGASLAIGNLTAEAPDGSQIFKSDVLSLHGLIGVGGHF
ncbi:MAG: hypothetical protein M3O50_01030 [Myxococcota bacterium]|nr:hypothetical protein [Myxococcota bacterium]